MDALIVALVLAMAMAVGGAGLRQTVEPVELPVALGGTAVLAAFVVLVGDSASLLNYRWPMAAVIGFALVCGVWMLPRAPVVDRASSSKLRQPRAALGLAVVALALAVPLFILPVPMDTDAQGFGYLALMIRNGGTLITLSPWHPEISYLYSPGALLIIAALSQLPFHPTMSSAMMGAAHAAAFFFVWLAWDFGRELGLHAARTAGSHPSLRFLVAPESWMWASGISAALSVGLWTALLDSHYTAIFALLFSLACLTCLFRYLRTGRVAFAALAALHLAAVAITQADVAIALAMGYGSLLFFGWLAADRPSLRQWLVVAAVIPASASAAVSAWLARIWPLLEAGIRSPFVIEPTHWRVLLVYHGLVWPTLALAGAAIHLRHRPLWAFTMVGWLGAAVEVSSVGLIQRILPTIGASLLRFTYPFSIAWHAPIIPYMALSAGSLVWFATRLNLRQIGRWFTPIVAAIGAFVLIAAVLNAHLLEASKGRLALYGAFASANDVLAMRWLRDHTPSDARVLNYPGDYEAGRDWEAHWAPVVSERDCVYFRSQPFFLIAGAEPDAGTAYEEQRTLLAFWRDPADPANSRLLGQARIGYVLVPESVGDPASLAYAWRWQPPALLTNARSLPVDAPYLHLVFSAGGAQVYKVTAQGGGGAQIHKGRVRLSDEAW